MRILITGSRTWANMDTIRNAIRRVIIDNKAAKEDTVIVHGACPRGADQLADIIAISWDVKVERYPADWGTHGRSAGFKRNQHMVDLGADVCLAFIKDNSKGASHTAKAAEAAGIPTKIYAE